MVAWVWQLSRSFTCSLVSSVNLPMSSVVSVVNSSPGSEASPSGRLNVTVFVGHAGWLVTDSSFSDSSESYRVSLPIESLSGVGSVAVSGT